MRFLGVTETCDLAGLYFALVHEGHVPGRIGAQEILHSLRKAGQLVRRIDPVDARIEPPDQLAIASGSGRKTAVP